MTLPIVEHFPVVVPMGFTPRDPDHDGTDLNWARKPCPCTTSPFQPRWGGGFRAGRIRNGVRLDHAAIDIMGPQGAVIRAIGPGTVPLTWKPGPGRVDPGAGTSVKGGNYVVIDDPTGWRWYFAHLEAVPLVHPGDTIEAGQPIGYLGRTGNAMKGRPDGTIYGCPHLHLALTAPNSRGVRDAKERAYDTKGFKVDSVPMLRVLVGAPR